MFGGAKVLKQDEDVYELPPTASFLDDNDSTHYWHLAAFTGVRVGAQTLRHEHFQAGFTPDENTHFSILAHNSGW